MSEVKPPPVKVALHKAVSEHPDRVTFTFGVTMNLGNFESLRVDASQASDMQPGEDYQATVQRLKDQVIVDVIGTAHRMRHKLQNEQPADIVRKPWRKQS